METRNTTTTLLQVHCQRCHQAASSAWSYCPHCGSSLGYAHGGSRRRRWTEMSMAALILAALVLPNVASLLQSERNAPLIAPTPILVAPTQEVSLQFQAPAKQWTDTGVDLPAGGNITIRSSGQWNPWIGHVPDMGPDGSGNAHSEDAMCPEAPWGALVGRIGNGPYFKIGSNARIHTDQGGRLTLGINDDYRSGGAPDNAGVLEVTISGDGLRTSAVRPVDIPGGRQ